MAQRAPLNHACKPASALLPHSGGRRQANDVVEQQFPRLGALWIPAAVGAEGSGHECFEEEHLQPLFLLFPENKPPFDPTRLHSSQRGMCGGTTKDKSGRVR